MGKPTGKVTFLFTDIEGSTKLAQEFPETLQASVEVHKNILTEAIESNNGFVFEIIGDAFCSAFEDAVDAVSAAVDIQKKLAEENWKEVVIKVRIGIHTGPAECIGEKYMGYITLARTARVMSSAYGEQILLTENTFNSINPEKNMNITFRDLGSRRMKDLIQPMNLYQVIYPGLREDFPPLKTLDARPNNLPMQLTNFIGRENEISEIKKILHHSKLVTLIGPGGTGKTRLSLQIAADVIDEYSGGVWFVEFAPVNDTSLVPNIISQALGIGEQSDKNHEQKLIDFLKEKELLLILDNCEHLIVDCAKLTEKLLQICPDLKIIITSREALKIEGETIYRVISMTHPDEDESYTPIQLTQYESVRLFIERALAVNPGFRVTNENAPALAQICSRLDGIPLAVELAAVRIKIMTVEKICKRLDDRFKLLTGGRRTALPRQQTLKALIDWSYDLLSEKEKIFLQRLSVFSGGWTLEQAEEICSDEIIDQHEILDLQSNLHDKSLIQSNENSGSIRFYMLQTIKEYSEELITDKEFFHKKHISFFKNLADQNQMRLEGISQLDWIKLMDADLNNLRTAVDRAIITDHDLSSNLINILTEYWLVKGFFSEGLKICEKLIKSGMKTNEENKATIFYNFALLASNAGYIAEAFDYVGKAEKIFRKLDIKNGLGKSLNIMGVVTGFDPAKESESKKYYEEALIIFRETKSESDIGTTLYNLSFSANRFGDLELSLKYKLEALEIQKKLNDTHSVALTLASLAFHFKAQKDYDQAKEYAEESLLISNSLQDKYLISINLVVLANIHSGKNDHEKSLELLYESMDMMKAGGYKASMLAAQMYIGEEYFLLDKYELAISNYIDSVKMGMETDNLYFLGVNIFGIGYSLYMMKDYENALKYFVFLKTITGNNNTPLSSAKAELAEELNKYIKETIGDEKFDLIYNQVSKLTRDEIFKFVLNRLSL